MHVHFTYSNVYIILKQKIMLSHIANLVLIANHCKMFSLVAFVAFFARGVFNSEMDTALDTVKDNDRKLEKRQLRNSE